MPYTFLQSLCSQNEQNFSTMLGYTKSEEAPVIISYNIPNQIDFCKPCLFNIYATQKITIDASSYGTSNSRYLKIIYLLRI